MPHLLQQLPCLQLLRLLQQANLHRVLRPSHLEHAGAGGALPLLQVRQELNQGAHLHTLHNTLLPPARVFIILNTAGCNKLLRTASFCKQCPWSELTMFFHCLLQFRVVAPDERRRRRQEDSAALAAQGQAVEVRITRCFVYCCPLTGDRHNCNAA